MIRWLAVIGMALVFMRLANVVTTAITARYPGIGGWLITAILPLVACLVPLGALYGVVLLVAHRQGNSAHVPSHVWRSLRLWLVFYAVLVAGGVLIYQTWGKTPADLALTLVGSAAILVYHLLRRQPAEQ